MPYQRFQQRATPAPEAGPDYLTIPATAVTVRSRFGNTHRSVTSSSVVLFALLRAWAAPTGSHVVKFVHGGRELETQSLAALNCYLRSWRIGRGGLPWRSSTRNRHDWRAFVAHLELVFR